MSRDRVRARGDLVRLLQDAHAGELAAAYAYRAHWRSLRRAEERAEVRRFEESGWVHRKIILAMLKELGEGPRPGRELVMGCIGRVFGLLCFVPGRFGPMYAAGRFEAMNVGRYVTARELADHIGYAWWGERLDIMRAEEDRHERWFGDRVRGHWLLRPTRFLLGWLPPEPLSQDAPEAA